MNTDFSSTAPPLANAPCFIETQFPVARISMESYKERKANYSQTLTGLGKWWGRKPLVLVRAALLGLLLPATADPVRDREIFLKLMTMDTAGLHQRKTKPIPQTRLVEELQRMAPSVRRRFLAQDAIADTSSLRRLNQAEREELQTLVFDRLPYVEKLTYCDRPEQVTGPTPAAWAEINAHLGTQATNLAEFVAELGERRFGHRPRVGDAFCGGGSIPFEAARLGCDVYASDLNPVAALLTWAALNIVGGGPEVAKEVAAAQQQVYAAVDRQICEWGIEHNSQGWRADAYLYCVEVIDPESGWRVPLAPSWVIGEKTHTIAKLVPDAVNKRYEIEIHEGVSSAEINAAKAAGTMQNFRLMPPHGGSSTPIEVLRRNLRLWENEDIVPRPDDIFQERLYCIRWVETYIDAKGKEHTRRHYRAPTQADLRREERILELLRERFIEWQEKGYIPSRAIEPGQDINRPTNARGWSCWHHFFNPRQMLLNGLFAENADTQLFSKLSRVALLLGLGRIADWNSRLSRWHSNAANEKGEQTFYKPSLGSPLVNYCCRSFISLKTAFMLDINPETFQSSAKLTAQDVLTVQDCSDLWITDPPYADAVYYHELSEYFLGWYDKLLPRIFSDWYTDSRRAMAVRGDDESFRKAMVAAYSQLARQMPDNGFQIVMFTHQDAGIWADLTMILWAAGLRVSSAWCIATETEAVLKQGNFVQGTVLLVLRKRTAQEVVFLDEITHRVEAEVRNQLDSMLALEDDSDPNFGDADYQLAAYAAALRVLTERPIEEIDPLREITRPRQRGEVSPVEQVIRNAVKIACDHLVPRGFDAELWRTLLPLERFYLKGVEVESHAEYRSGVYQELARGFGAVDYTELLASTKANETRLKSAGEFGRRQLGNSGFGASLLRQALFAVQQTAKEDDPRTGLNWLKTELPNYWQMREKLIHILDYLARLGAVSTMVHWRNDAAAAQLLAGVLRNDHI
jgi:adenine-specific DNA methylase